MLLDFSELTGPQTYHTLIQTVIPRPIAWVLTENGQGEDEGYNLAPFSYFSLVSFAPPMLMLSIGPKKAGAPLKDTLTNILERKSFVCHIASRDMAEALNETARERQHGDSEVAAGGLDLTPFDGFALPRLAGCKVAFACDLEERVPLRGSVNHLIIGRIRQLWLDDGITGRDAKGRLTVDAEAMDPLGRLGGNDYSRLGEIITLPRPA